MQKIVEFRASAFIPACNHPSGNVQPGKMDVELTEKIKRASEYSDSKLLDHLIVYQDTYLSFSDYEKI